MRILLLALAFSTSALLSTVRADTLTATLKQPLQESSHWVDIRVKNGVATYTVRRSFANLGKRHEEAQLRIQLPFGAAVTGLRIRGKEKWHRGELMRADTARSLYKELTGMGPHVPRDPALLQWVWADQVHLHVFPVAPKSATTVEYTLTVPTRYRDGHYILYYPMTSGAKNLTTPVVRLFASSRNTELFFDGVPTKDGEPNVGKIAAMDENPLLKGLSSSGSHKVSALTVTRDDALSSVRVMVDIKHTFRSDLRVVLVSPSGREYVLHDVEGGSDNDLRLDRVLQVPKGTRGKGTWSLLTSDMAGLDTGTLESWSLRFTSVKKAKFSVVATDTPISIPDAPNGEGISDMHVMTLGAGPIQVTAARLGLVDTIKDKQFQRLEIDVASPLQPLPKNLSVVFVLDLSKSLSEEDNRAQLEIARAYLSHVPKASFQLVGYRRIASALTKRFHLAHEFDVVVKTLQDGGAFEQGNGSALGRGTKVAKTLLASRKGTRRIVLMNDLLLRPSWNNTDAIVHLPKNVVTHLVKPQAGAQVGLSRLNIASLNPIARARGGILATMSGADAEHRKELELVSLELVRPTQIDKVSVTGPTDLNVPSILREGSSVREMVGIKRGSKKVVLTGELWSTPYRKVIRTKSEFNRASAGFVFSHDMYDDLSDEEQFKLAMYGRAVSPMTAYLAIEPGVRPSTAGIEDRVLTGTGAGFGVGSGRGAMHGRLPMPPKYWQTMFASAKRRCADTHKPVAGWSLRIGVYTNYAEVVDVGLAVQSVFGRCLLEAAWQFDLDSMFHHQSSQSWLVELRD